MYWCPGSRLNMESSFHVWIFHDKDDTVVRPSCLYHGDPYTGEKASSATTIFGFNVKEFQIYLPSSCQEIKMLINIFMFSSDISWAYIRLFCINFLKFWVLIIKMIEWLSLMICWKATSICYGFLARLQLISKLMAPIGGNKISPDCLCRSDQ